MRVSHRFVLELDRNDVRALRALARALRRRTPRAFVGAVDLSSVIGMCLREGQAILAKKLERSCRTPLDVGGRNEPGSAKSEGDPPGA